VELEDERPGVVRGRRRRAGARALAAGAAFAALASPFGPGCPLP
jgi:hypothetical protein